MKDVSIFLGGVIVKSGVGFLVGSALKNAVQHERKAIITSHVLDSHNLALRICGIADCSKL